MSNLVTILVVVDYAATSVHDIIDKRYNTYLPYFGEILVSNLGIASHCCLLCSVRIRFPSHTIIHIKWTDLGSDPGTRKAQKVPALSEHDKSTSNPRIASL